MTPCDFCQSRTTVFAPLPIALTLISGAVARAARILPPPAGHRGLPLRPGADVLSRGSAGQPDGHGGHVLTQRGGFGAR